MTAQPDTRTAERTRPVPRRLSVGLGSGTVLQPLNSSMIAVAIVAIGQDFGSSSGIAWVISALYIATAVTAPTAGRLGALFGARRVYLGGLTLIALGAVAGALAPSLGWLIAARVLLGIGTATQYPNAMTIVREYADRHGAQPRSAIATLAACAQVVVALGPTLGGLLVGAFGWQSIMWVNLPIAAVSAAWVLAVAAPDGPRRAGGTPAEVLRSLDPAGMALFLAGTSTLMFFLLSLTTGPAWWLVPACATVWVAFVAWESRAAAPFIDVRALAGNRTLSTTLGRTLITYTAFYCVFFGLPQWLQGGRGMSPAAAGLMMLPVAGVGVFATMTASRLYGRHGARRTLLVGTTGLVAGGLLLALAENSTSPIGLILVVAAILGIPNGFNNMGNQNLVNSATSAREVGTAIGMYRTIQYVGANLAAVVIEVTMRDGADDMGLHRTGAVIAVLGATLLVGVLFSRTLREH
ncbi:MFS transporter [Rhodococcus spelaei]|uniref:MFS transporter n=1 Tax=Rhodococcus spelaei TaxID=2546320 RepID=A0A541BPK1_9NOCA|nr:MFS transporter [Rhodococcus spelaei]TQF74232.1 MFS transporter [Rhodococcus spelaei]